MRYALDENKHKIEVSHSGQRAVCPGCATEVTGKIYSDKKDHWAHLKKDCDSWYEPISDWHLSWQNLFPQKNQEVILFDEENSEYHRADIKLDNGVVIEVQNSPIVIKEVEERENFYNRNGLIWILNAENLIPKCEFKNCIHPGDCEVKISFNNEYYLEYELENIISSLVKKAYADLETLTKINTENEFIFTFIHNHIIDSGLTKESIKYSIESLNWKYSRHNHNINYIDLYKVDVRHLYNKFSVIKYLCKSQWRKFIDKMNAPVFLDNVTNLDSNYLFWVQKGKVVEKSRFIEKYLKYT